MDLIVRSRDVNADENLGEMLRKTARALGIMALAAGALMMAAFATKAAFGATPSTAGDRLDFWTGFGVVLLSAAWLFAESPGLKRITPWVAFAVVVTASAAFFESVGLLTFPALFGHEPLDSKALWVDEMIIFASFGLALLGLSVFLEKWDSLKGLAQIPALVTLIIAAFGLIGLSYHGGPGGERGELSRILLIPASASALLSLMILCGSAGRGVMALLTSRSLPGQVLRRLLPAICLGPYLIGWFLISERGAGFSFTGFDLALLVVTLQILLGLFIWLNSAILVNLEKQKIDLETQERMRASELRLSEERFSLAFEQVAVGMAYVRWDGKFLKVNRRFCEILGYSEEELLATDFQAVTHPADVGQDEAMAARVASGELQTYTMEKRYIRKDGGVVWVSLTVSVVRNENGTPKFFFSVIQDIMERKKAEERLRNLYVELERRVVERTQRLSESVAALEREVLERRKVEDRLEQAMGDLRTANAQIRSVMESTSDIIVAVDKDLRYLAFNDIFQKTFFRFFGRAVKVGDALTEVIPEVEGKNAWILDLWKRALAGEQGMSVGKLDVDGETHSFEITISPLRNETGAIIGATEFIRDVSERAKAAEVLAVAKLAAESANQAKSAFLANMSHEIRTPISVIIGYAEMLAKPGMTEEDRMLFGETILRNGNNLLALINDILDLSKVEAGFLKMELQRVPLIPFFAEILSQMRFRASAAGLTLTWGVRGSIPKEIVTDGTRLRQILYNLTSNAIKFTPQGRIDVFIDMLPESGLLRITVEDTGIGISQEGQANLFKPFTQADPSVVRRFGGTGLGLHLSRQLAQKLGGTVELVRTAPGEGSSFAATVACGDLSGVEFVTEEDFAHETGEPGRVAETTTKDERLKNLKILVAEDFVDSQDLFRRILQSAGAAVAIVTDGRQAVDQALASDFDLILMDLQMPVVDGYEATRELRRRNFRKPIVALTAHAMKGEVEKCLEAGCNDFLSKPIEKDLLLETIRKAVAGPASRGTVSAV